MDAPRRLAKPVTDGARARPADRARPALRKPTARRAIATTPLRAWARRSFDGWARMSRRWLTPIESCEVPRGTGTAVVLAFMLVSTSYGVVRGGHLPEIATELAAARDAAA